ncbi:MAG: patatin-like phospholipase family protein [Verrucomicrobiales bacterium]|nr:patatin-like phospholipase family protein [Verrucomicrobiales bacterium]
MAAFFHLLDSLRTDRTESCPVPEPKAPRIGIAFSSGGAKGLAHIGVIQVLEENGIPIAGIAGSSMGAYVGGLWASGKNGTELEKLAAEMASKRDLFGLVDPVFPPRRGFLRGHSIRERLEKTLRGRTFAELDRPFLAVATELDTLERAVLREGDVASAIVASLAVPGVVVPVTRDGVEYIDGGVCDPLPVTLARETWDLDVVIGVNVLPPIGSLRRRKARPSKAKPWRKVLSAVNRHLNYFARGNLLDILRGAAMGSQMRLVGRSARSADVLISAISSGSGWHDYHNYRHYIEVGREAALKALPEIKALLAPAPAPATPKSNPNTEEASCV